MTSVRLLPLFNFFQFVFLAQRVVRVKFKYCDEIVSDTCMVSLTWYFESLEGVLLYGTGLVLTLHLFLPAVQDLEDAWKQDSAYFRLNELHDYGSPAPPLAPPERQSAPAPALAGRSEDRPLEKPPSLTREELQTELDTLQELRESGVLTDDDFRILAGGHVQAYRKGGAMPPAMALPQAELHV